MDQQNPIQTTSSNNPVSKILLLLFIIIGFITAFAGGYFLNHFLATEQNVSTSTNSKPTNIPYIAQVTSYPAANNPQIAQDTTKFLPGKYYFEDTVIAITKDKPALTIAATVTRTEQDTNYAQNSRISYYDGKIWKRFSDNKTTQDSTIVSDNLVKNWTITIDPSRVLKETIQGKLTVNNTDISFNTGNLENEMAIRSLPGYTKFMSHGNGTITIDGKIHPAYILYTRIYSLNASEIQFYNQPFGLTTDWVAFWDIEGNFYHVDATAVDKPTPIYQSHHLGIFDDANNGVEKTFALSITRDQQVPPITYTILLQTPVVKTLTFTRVNSVNKAPNNSFTWYMGNIVGTVTGMDGKAIPGIGLVEYIHD